jgi:hypothetical protein
MILILVGKRHSRLFTHAETTSCDAMSPVWGSFIKLCFSNLPNINNPAGLIDFATSCCFLRHPVWCSFEHLAGQRMYAVAS